MSGNNSKFYKQRSDSPHQLSNNPNEHVFMLKTEDQTVIIIIDWTNSRSAKRITDEKLDMKQFYEIHPNQYPLSHQMAQRLFHEEIGTTVVI